MEKTICPMCETPLKVEKKKAKGKKKAEVVYSCPECGYTTTE